MNTATDHVRLFVACEVPDDARETIGEIIETLKGRSGSAVRWIRPEGVHVTLKFLGEVPVRQLPASPPLLALRKVSAPEAAR